jgi:PAS domain S-box-containing protein
MLKSSLNAMFFILIGSMAVSVLVTIYLITLGHTLEPNLYTAPALVGGVLGLFFYFWHTKTDQIRTRLVHLNIVLKTIREINILLAKEKDRALLIQGICDILVESRGYSNAWIALKNEAGQWESFTESGLIEASKVLWDRVKSGDLTTCCKRALSQTEIVITDDPVRLCSGCPLADSHADRGALSRRIEYDGKIYGVMTLSISKELASDTEEQELVAEISDDIAYGLYNLEVQTERGQTERELRISMDTLGVRIKELNCLFSLSRLVDRPHITLEEIFQGVIDLILPAWQYPEVTCARIEIDQQEFKSADFRETAWRLEKEIMVNNQQAGKIAVCYLEEMPVLDEGPFLHEERSLINALAERLGRIIERKRSETALVAGEKRFRTLVENSLVGISIIQDNQVIYQNKEQERLLGPLPRSVVLADYDNIHPDDLDRVKKLSHEITSGKIQVLDVTFRYARWGDTENRIWIHCRGHVIDYRGKESILVSMMDMTQIKELEDMLLVQDKMASLGRVSAGIAHEIRNPLSGINIYTNTLQKFVTRGEDEKKIQDVLQNIQSASRKIESVIRRVMDFSKPSEPHLIVANINDPVDEAVKLTSVTLRKSGIKIEKNLANDLRKCRLDPNQIEEVILNLINNAADAMRHADAEKIIKLTTSNIGPNLLVVVSDSGPGISPKNLNKVFDPFFTTKSDSTGIGLSICRRIVADHGGIISVQTNRWGGAKFCVTIPAITALQTQDNRGE